METLGSTPWKLDTPFVNRDSAGSNFQVLFFPTPNSFTHSPKRFPVNAKTIQAAYATAETYEGPKPEGPFRSMDLVSPRTWLSVTLTPRLAAL